MSRWFAFALGPLTQPWGLVAAGVAVIVDAKLGSWESGVALVVFCLLSTATYLAAEIYAWIRPEETQRAARPGTGVDLGPHRPGHRRHLGGGRHLADRHQRLHPAHLSGRSRTGDRRRRRGLESAVGFRTRDPVRCTLQVGLSRRGASAAGRAPACRRRGRAPSRRCRTSSAARGARTGRRTSPAAVPVNPGCTVALVSATGPAAGSAGGREADVGRACGVKPRAPPGTPGPPPCRRRCDDSIRMTTTTMNGMTATQEWPPPA